MLLVDEAHATGVFGPHGRGVAEQCGVDDPGVIRIGTLSKALGAAGGFVCGSRSLIDWLANRARTYVFSTAQPAATCAAALAALDIVEREPQRRRELLETADRAAGRASPPRVEHGRFRQPDHPPGRRLAGRGGATERANCESAAIWVPAIRPPSVPPGESLLRLSLTAAHTRR